MNITDTIHYVGVNDRNKHLFEGLWPIPYGVSYNSYIIDDERTALIDTVDSSFFDRFIVKVREVLGDRPVDYLVINHMEPDHSGSIKLVRAFYPDVVIVGNKQTLSMVQGYYGDTDTVLEVKDGDRLDLGHHKLSFHLIPMVHWPEVMVTYEQTEKILFSADGFGKFGAIEPEEDWDCEARRYYFGIVGKYGMQVQALLKKVANLDIQMICPLHGPILKENLGYFIDKYNTWSSYKPEEEGIYIACSSIYGNTLKAAEKLAEILKEKGAKKVVLGDLTKEDWAEAVEDVFRYSHLIVASSSYNAGVFPPMKQFLDRLKERNYQSRTVGIIENGSWAPSAGKCMKNVLQEMKDINIVEPVITIKSTMSEENIKQMEEMADKIL